MDVEEIKAKLLEKQSKTLSTAALGEAAKEASRRRTSPQLEKVWRSAVLCRAHLKGKGHVFYQPLSDKDRASLRRVVKQLGWELGVHVIMNVVLRWDEFYEKLRTEHNWKADPEPSAGLLWYKLDEACAMLSASTCADDDEGFGQQW